MAPRILAVRPPTGYAQTCSVADAGAAAARRDPLPSRPRRNGCVDLLLRARRIDHDLWSDETAALRLQDDRARPARGPTAPTPPPHEYQVVGADEPDARRPREHPRSSASSREPIGKRREALARAQVAFIPSAIPAAARRGSTSSLRIHRARLRASAPNAPAAPRDPSCDGRDWRAVDRGPRRRVDDWSGRIARRRRCSRSAAYRAPFDTVKYRLPIPSIAPWSSHDRPGDRVQAVGQRVVSRMRNPIAPLVCVQGPGNNVAMSGANVVVARRSRPRAVHLHRDRRSVVRDRLGLRRQRPAEVHEGRPVATPPCSAYRSPQTASSRLRCRTSSSACRAAWSCARRRTESLCRPVLRPHVEHVCAVPLARQHVGEHHEPPARLAVHGASGTLRPHRAARRR